MEGINIFLLDLKLNVWYYSRLESVGTVCCLQLGQWWERRVMMLLIHIAVLARATCTAPLSQRFSNLLGLFVWSASF